MEKRLRNKINFIELEKLAEELVETKLSNSPPHIKEMEKSMIFASLILETSNLRLSQLYHPKRCKRCGSWLRRKYIHILIGYRYYCPQCGNEFFISLRRLVENTLR